MQAEQVSNPRCPTISFSEEEILSFYKPWSKAVVVKVLERSFPYPVLRKRLESLWARSGHIQVADMSNSFFLVRFSDDEDYQRAAFEGPWKMAVERIGNHIGKTIRLDLATKEGTRARYARVCVEVDLSCPLLGKYIIEDRVFYVEYESLDNICFSCGIYGHKDGSCPNTVPTETATPTPQPTQPEINKAPEGDSGSWMSVKRRQKKITPPQASISQPKTLPGSRFNILTSDDPVIDTTEAVNGKENPAVVQDVPSSVNVADALKRVLDNALGKKEVPKGRANKAPKSVPGPSSRKVLADVTNAEESSFAAPQISIINQEGLVNVPVMIANPIFQSNKAKQKVKPKQKSKENPSPKVTKTPKVSNLRKFNPRKSNVESSSAPVHLMPVESLLEGKQSGGRPPDTLH
ncbi:hypothetical protein LINPERHAP2_LOCUS35459 [Linum perenne]